MKPRERKPHSAASSPLSVSSNGSTWVKPWYADILKRYDVPFSILERIDVGETSTQIDTSLSKYTFSILERIDVGET